MKDLYKAEVKANKKEINHLIKIIKTIKSKLISKGLCENFGEEEVRLLKDTYNYNPHGNYHEKEIAKKISEFSIWTLNYTGKE